MFRLNHTVLVHEYASLGAPFVTRVPATPWRTPARLLHANCELADELGIDDLLSNPGTLGVLSGSHPLAGYDALASVYCGHQFGVFVPQLGDGRALLIGEVRSQGAYHQLQLKGAGPTPYSRHADGRAVLRSSIREYLASHAMHHLGIPTTRALSLTASHDPVFRETTETAAIVCRVSESFLRFGHIEFFAYSNQHAALRELLVWHIAQHHPELNAPDNPEADITQVALDWFETVALRTARMVALWQAVGFCHGVMNTDNMSLLGLTIDYGPYGFLDNFDINHICNHSDDRGRYSYRNQPAVAHWNLHALAHALAQIVPAEQSEYQARLDRFAEEFHRVHSQVFAAKLGLWRNTDGPRPDFSSHPAAAIEWVHSLANTPAKPEHDEFIEYTLNWLHENTLDMTRFFRSLSALNPRLPMAENWASWQRHGAFALSLGNQAHVENGQAWLSRWLAVQQAFGADGTTTGEQLNHINPTVIARNHLLQEVIEAAQQDQLEPLNKLFAALSDPYGNTQPDEYTNAPPEWARSLVLSCSS